MLINVTVLNNYPTLHIDDVHKNKVNIIQNDGQPSFSTGHLARSWNQCIINAIKNINDPDCDVLILAQNDVVFKPFFLTEIINCLDKFTFISFGRGDEVQVLTPDAIKSIGIYDERFCNIGFQEADYFLRAVLLNNEKTSINDIFHNRIYNGINNNVTLDVPTGYQRNDEFHIASSSYHRNSRTMFSHKWAGILPNPQDPENWTDLMKNLRVCPCQYMFYPYFEKDFPNLDDKYIVY